MYLASLLFGLQASIVLRYTPIIGANKVSAISHTISMVSLFIIFIICIAALLFVSYIVILSIGLLVLSLGLNSIQQGKLRISQKFTKVLLFVFIQVAVSLSLFVVFRDFLSTELSLFLVSLSFLLPVVMMGDKIHLHAKLDVKKRLKLLRDHNEALRYAAPILLIGLSNFMMSSLDQYFLNYLGHKDELSAYIANYNIAEKSVFVILSVITLVFVPSIFNRHKKLTMNTFKDIFTVEIYFIVISLFAVVFVSHFSKNLTAILTSSQYVTHSWIIPYIAGGALLLGINSLLSEVLTVQYKSKLVLVCYLIGLACNIILNAIFIREYGVPGAITTTLFSYLVTLLATIYFVRKEYLNLTAVNNG